ncbi:MAG: metallophosphoesterase [Archangiaceae bacterium]|nr:metallophosphoesterase [Archangiaceae bacterium]
MRLSMPLVALGVGTAVLAAEPPRDFAAYEDAYQFECNAPWVRVGSPLVTTHQGWQYEYGGASVKVRREGAPAKGPVKLGLLAGIKDLEPETQRALQLFLAAFEKADVEAIIVGGDTAEQTEVLDQVYAWLPQQTRRPIVSIAGNTERAGAHNYAIAKARKAGAQQLVNMGLIRRYDGPGFDLVSLSGYHDKTYLHLSGGCIYSDQALTDAEAAIRAADDPVIMLVHGPPRQSGKQSLDFVPGAGNVGDPRLTELLKRNQVQFGTFGHILEAGGHGTDLSGKPLPAKKLHPALYVDQGSANPLPWKMNDGTTAHGSGGDHDHRRKEGLVRGAQVAQARAHPGRVMMRAALLFSLVITACSGGAIDLHDAGSSDAGRAPSDAGAHELVAAHNAVRARAMPTPSPALPLLTWSDAAAAVAADWAARCSFAHNPAISGIYGENIFAASSSAFSPTAVVENWAEEIIDYDYVSNHCASVCGHYTQIVWRTTSAVGCASTVCTRNSPFGGQAPWLFWVCDYEPPGNVNGQRPY